MSRSVVPAGREVEARHANRNLEETFLRAAL
jgi:hypothetical protein